LAPTFERSRLNVEKSRRFLLIEHPGRRNQTFRRSALVGVQSVSVLYWMHFHDNQSPSNIRRRARTGRRAVVSLVIGV